MDRFHKLVSNSFYKTTRGVLLHGDCLDIMRDVPDKSIDLILCDPPYGVTACEWDRVLPISSLWEHFSLIIKDDGVIAMFGTEPFSSFIRTSKIEWYRYDWIWNKKLAGNGILARKQPLKIHENISIFSKKPPRYFPIMEKRGKPRKKMTGNPKVSQVNFGGNAAKETYNNLYYPVSILEYSAANLRTGRLHPTQKPVELYEYLIRTYTKEGDVILDCCAGSGTTAIACHKTLRKWILIEKDLAYCEKIVKRIEQIPEALF